MRCPLGLWFAVTLLSLVSSQNPATVSQSCNVDQAEKCLAELQAQYDEVLSHQRTQRGSDRDVVKLCIASLRGNNSTRCFQMTTQSCQNASDSPANYIYQDLQQDINGLCDSECNGFRNVSICVNQVSSADLQMNLQNFCRTYQEGLQCVESSVGPCNISQMLFQEMLGTDIVDGYNAFCIPGAQENESATCNLDEAEKCLTELQDLRDRYLSSYVAANSTKDTQVDICVTSLLGNKWTSCYKSRTSTCSRFLISTANFEFQDVITDLRVLCQKECPDLHKVQDCQALVNYTASQLQDPSQFCRSVFEAERCVTQFTCGVATQVLGKLIYANAGVTQSTCNPESCFGPSLRKYSGLRMLKPKSSLCLDFLKAHACALKPCGKKNHKDCIGRLSPQIQAFSSQMFSLCHQVLKKSDDVNRAGKTIDRGINALGPLLLLFVLLKVYD